MPSNRAILPHKEIDLKGIMDLLDRVPSIELIEEDGNTITNNTNGTYYDIFNELTASKGKP
jgi:hypothetical protein